MVLAYRDNDGDPTDHEMNASPRYSGSQRDDRTRKMSSSVKASARHVMRTFMLFDDSGIKLAGVE